MRHAVMLVTSFSGLPLRLAGWLGLGVVAMGLLLGMAALGQIMLGGADWGWSVLMLAVIVFIGGLQLLVLGLAGEYLAQMHRRLMGMGAYAVREEFRGERQGSLIEQGERKPGERNLEGVELVS
jgi:undecaprenyl-phosphate 4-deoxy-4-formamido-L-arabinose transferase